MVKSGSRVSDGIYRTLTAADAVVVPPSSDTVLVEASVRIVVTLTTTSVMLADTAPGIA